MREVILGIIQMNFATGDIKKDFAMDYMNEATKQPFGPPGHLFTFPVEDLMGWSMYISRTKAAAPAIQSATRGDPRRAFGKLLYFLVLLPFIAFPAANAEEPAPMNIEGAITITAKQLIEMAGSIADLVVVDARNQTDWQRGHIDGTIHMVNTEMTEQGLAAVARRDQPVVFYCNGPKCYRSGDASRKAVGWGWKKIFWFRGGTEEWSDRGYPLTK